MDRVLISYTRLKLVLILIILLSCSSENRQEFAPYHLGEIIYEETFDTVDTTAWMVESENDVKLESYVSDGSLTLSVPGGITVWNTTRFSGNVLFEFEATVVKAGGTNDRVSDLNCFWMATDPDFPDDFFARSAWRKGVFWNYYTLNLYYVGYGGHDNTKTRMRKYDVSLKPPPPIIKEYDDAAHLITPNKKNLIQIVCFESRVKYIFNGEELFDIAEEHPYRDGYFGFRTTNNHMRVEGFKVYSLEVKM